MAKNEEGEFELVLGNRQLISVFLIVVILLGVFFSMGYIVGRNSAPAVVAVDPRNSRAAADASPEKSSPSTASAQDSPAQPADVKPTDVPVTTHPQQAETEPGKPSPSPAAKETKPKPVTPERFSATDPAAGDYWQVVATARPDAEIITEALAKKGFHAVVAPAPKDGIFRVLVGPLKDAATEAQTRTSLEAAGFKNPIMRKY